MKNIDEEIIDDRIGGHLSSVGLAELIVSALKQAKMIKASDYHKAVDIVAEEIDVRKMIKDY